MDRYGRWVVGYDVVSLEWPVYRPGRRAGVAALRLSPGDRVLDLGCGTGLSFGLLREAVGASGEVVGLDASPAMLAQARRRVHRQGWTGVHTVLGDATRIPAAVRAAGPFDAVLATYALSLLGPWREAWQQAWDLVRPGGRACVVDLALPDGRWRALAPAARLACALGGSDPARHPWTQLEAEAEDVTHLSLRGGHVHVVSGARPA